VEFWRNNAHTDGTDVMLVKLLSFERYSQMMLQHAQLNNERTVTATEGDLLRRMGEVRRASFCIYPTGMSRRSLPFEMLHAQVQACES
jgi:hypothetical protein